LIASDDEGSNYVDPHYNDDTTIELEEEEVTRPGGKNLLPLKPKAATTKYQKIEKNKSSSEAKGKAKEEKRNTNENRIMIRNKKRVEREKRSTRVSKRVRRTADFFINVKKF